MFFLHAFQRRIDNEEKEKREEKHLYFSLMYICFLLCMELIRLKYLISWRAGLLNSPSLRWISLRSRETHAKTREFRANIEDSRLFDSYYFFAQIGIQFSVVLKSSPCPPAPCFLYFIFLPSNFTWFTYDQSWIWDRQLAKPGPFESPLISSSQAETPCTDPRYLLFAKPR